mmetsp:Transcript_16703/g.52574  ORF Transcript_16703/g.52574 Transcript_16703/m.52574 type:complete len:271 (-) Transcript_16703:359-1171(-)
MGASSLGKGFSPHVLLEDLDSVVHEVVVEDEGAAVAVQGPAVVPEEEEAEHLAVILKELAGGVIVHLLLGLLHEGLLVLLDGPVGEGDVVGDVEALAVEELAGEGVAGADEEPTRVHLHLSAHAQILHADVAIAEAARVGHAVALEEHALGEPRVVLLGLADLDAPILEVEVDDALAHAPVLLAPLNHGLTEESIEAEDLAVVSEPGGDGRGGPGARRDGARAARSRWGLVLLALRRVLERRGAPRGAHRGTALAHGLARVGVLTGRGLG